jgi:hypothetical protein
MITNMSSLHKNTLTYLSTIRKYYSTSSTSSYVCTRQHDGNSQKRHNIYGAKNGEKWQMLPNVGPTFSDILPTCRPTRQCRIKNADADIRQTQLSLATSYCLNRNNRVSSFYWTRGSKLCFLTYFSYFSRYFLILVFSQNRYPLICLRLSQLHGNPISCPVSCTIGTPS